ncbi:hypothetical protein RQP46_007767 [Phenoliferia psychrophenolica]
MSPSPSSTSDIFLYFLAIFLPPLSVFFKRGCAADFWINICLSILGFIPGVLHAWWIISKNERPAVSAAAPAGTRNPLSGGKPMKTLRPAASVGIVGLAVDPSPGGANFLASGYIDSVLCLCSMNGTKRRTRSSAHSADGRFLAVASDTGHVSLFDASTGSLVSTFPAHSAPIRSTSFTSSFVVTAPSDDKRINVFDRRVLSGASRAGGRKGQVASLGGHDGWVASVEARNDRLLASGYVTLS